MTELPASIAVKSTVPVAAGLTVAVMVSGEPLAGEAEKEIEVWVTIRAGETALLAAEPA